MKHVIFNTAETKARLNELLVQVEGGKKILIRRRDKIVAMLTQPGRISEKEGLLRGLRQFRAVLRKKHGRRSHTLDLLAETRREAR